MDDVLFHFILFDRRITSFKNISNYIAHVGGFRVYMKSLNADRPISIVIER